MKKDKMTFVSNATDFHLGESVVYANNVVGIKEVQDNDITESQWFG